MSTSIVGLKFNAPEKVKTEEQLIDVFNDLREQYKVIDPGFSLTHLGKDIQNFSDFLGAAMDGRPIVDVKGSGIIGGLEVKNGCLKYDLSSVRNLTMYWDQRRDGSCHTCHKIRQTHISSDLKYYCYVKGINEKKLLDPSYEPPMDWSGQCRSYAPRITNSKGKVARKLLDIIQQEFQ